MGLKAYVSVIKTEIKTVTLLYYNIYVFSPTRINWAELV